MFLTRATQIGSLGLRIVISPYATDAVGAAEYPPRRRDIVVTMHLYSASQVTGFVDCERKWAWRYIAGIKTPQNASAALGTEVDDTQLQPYLRDGRPLDFSRESGYIAAPGLVFLPQPMTSGLEVQKRFVIPSPSFADGKHIGFGFQGYLDLWLPNGGMPDIEDDNPIVCDFKTTGNWKYAKTPKDLETDPQAQLYATWAMYATKKRVVDLAWVYFSTKGTRKAKRVHLRVHGDHVAEQFERINGIAIRMDDIRKTVTDPLELKPNVDMCESYGGCPYRDKCNLSPAQIIDAKVGHWARQMEDSVMGNTTQGGGNAGGLLARLKKQREEALAAAGGAAPVTADDVAKAEAALPTWLTSPVDPRKALGINPPESALPPAPPVGAVEAPAAPVEAKKGPGRPRKNAVPAPEDPKQLLLATTPDPIGTFTHPEFSTAATVTVVWAEETICPVPYNPFKVGPFKATGEVRKGETIAQAMGRIYYELAAFAESARAAKAKSFAAALTAGGGK